MSIKQIVVGAILAAVVTVPAVAVYKHVTHEETAAEFCGRTVELLAQGRQITASDTLDEMTRTCIGAADHHYVTTSQTPDDYARQENSIQYTMAKTNTYAYSKEYTAIMLARIEGYTWAYAKVKAGR